MLYQAVSSIEKGRDRQLSRHTSGAYLATTLEAHQEYGDDEEIGGKAPARDDRTASVLPST